MYHYARDYDKSAIILGVGAWGPSGKLVGSYWDPGLYKQNALAKMVVALGSSCGILDETLTKELYGFCFHACVRFCDFKPLTPNSLFPGQILARCIARNSG